MLPFEVLAHILNEVSNGGPESRDDLHDSVVTSAVELVLHPLVLSVAQWLL